MTEQLILLAMVLAAVSGVPGLFLSPHTNVGQRLATFLLVTGCALGLTGVGVFCSTQTSEELRYDWLIPGAEFRVEVDGLSALFLVPVFLIPLLGSIYGLVYWKQIEHPGNATRLQLFYGLLPAGMALLVIARNGVLFLFGWEVMALSAFFLVSTEDQNAEVREAGWIYLVATHTSTLCLFALFALLASVNGSFTLEPISAESLFPGMATTIFVLTLVGFGVKAGVMPLHVWLPGAHAMAPSHVSAVMSGVLLKMGIYGIVRVTSLMPNPPVEWGAVVLALGVISGVLGVAYAIGQHDIKRLLAYHSIENIGIILMGLGVALLGRSMAREDWVVLGLAGGLLHVWNHAFFKALLFFSAGSVIHATHTREIDHLGGLARMMPWTACCFVAGAVAICGLPPLNGFVSEWFVYLGLFRCLGIDPGNTNPGPALAGAALAAPALALIGALALACFVKVFGAVFLGTARSAHASKAHESPPAMIGPMLVLVGLCLFIGLAPLVVTPILGLALEAWQPNLADVESADTQLRTLAPLTWITGMGIGLLAGLLVVGILYAVLLRDLRWSRAHLGVRILGPYSAHAIHLLFLRPDAGGPVRLGPDAPRRTVPQRLPIFPQPSHFHSETPDAVLDQGVLPAMRFGAGLCERLRVFQQGRVQFSLLYVFLTLVALLLWR